MQQPPTHAAHVVCIPWRHVKQSVVLTSVELFTWTQYTQLERAKATNSHSTVQENIFAPSRGGEVVGVWHYFFGAPFAFLFSPIKRAKKVFRIFSNFSKIHAPASRQTLSCSGNTQINVPRCIVHVTIENIPTRLKYHRSFQHRKFSLQNKQKHRG